MMTRTVCALCGQQAVLQQSHIVPDFIIQWMKQESATGRLMQATNPNVPRQGGPRTPLLCKTCEQRFGVCEGSFAKRIFKPFQSGYRGSFAYGEWLRRYAVSQSWRTTFVSSTELCRLERPVEYLLVQRALEEWRAYLLGERTDPGPYEHHLWLYDVEVDGAPGSLDPRFEYLRGGIDWTFVCLGGKVCMYTKLPRMVLWSTIRPVTAVGWMGTNIEANGIIRPPQGVTDADFLRFFFGRVERAADLTLSKLSIKRRERLTGIASAHPSVSAPDGGRA